MFGKARQILNTILYGSMLLTLLFIVLSNGTDKIRLLLLSLLLIGTLLIRNQVPENNRLFGILILLTYAADLVLLFIISWIDHTNISQFYYYALISDITLLVQSRYSIPYSVLCYVCMILVRYLKYTRWNYFDPSYFLPVAMESAFYFIFVFLILYIVRSQVIQSRILDETNKRLQETMGMLEEVTILKERNRIAREIHDTVGHTLTTVLVEIEAGKRLMSRDREQSLSKLELAQEQVRKGLQDIRGSVKTLSEGNELLAFIPSLRSLIAETEKHAGVKVEYRIGDFPEVPNAYQRILYHALQEGLTNGIKHGNSTRFELVLTWDAEQIHFKLQDNGAGCKNLKLGFGLNNMKIRVEEAGGTFFVDSGEGDGFGISLTLPGNRGEKDE